jgi:hypothetical protein
MNAADHLSVDTECARLRVYSMFQRAPADDMQRFRTIALLLLMLGVSGVALAQTSLDTSGSLDGNDPVSDDGAHYEEHRINLQEGQTVVIEMKSEAFDTYLVLKAPDGEIVETNDDGDFEETGTDSALEYEAESAGTFVILATSLFPESRGEYTLKATVR